MECLVVNMPDMSALSTPSTFVKVDEMGSAQIPVANFSPHPHIIQPREVLGVAQDPHSWLDEPSLRKKAEAEKMVVFLDKLSQNGEKVEPFPDKDEEDELLGPKMARSPIHGQGYRMSTCPCMGLLARRVKS